MDFRFFFLHDRREDVTLITDHLEFKRTFTSS